MPQSLARHCIIPAPGLFAPVSGAGADTLFSDGVEILSCKGYDCVIRAGRIDDSTAGFRPLASFNWVIAASPTYIERCGSPENLDDLQSTMRSAT